MPADARFTIRAFRDGDEAQILALFARAFPHAARGLDHFQWKYQRSPFGNERISLTFDDAQRLVAQYAGYPVFLVDGGWDLVAHQIGDIMTDRSVRHVGRGPTSILARTAVHFYESFCRAKVAFNYGFTTAAHRELSVRFLGSDAVEPVTYRVREMARNPFVRIGRRARWPRGWQLELVHDVGPEFDDFFERVAPAYRFLVRRDARYLRWRYLECPDVPYFIVAIRKWRRLVGWSVFGVRGSRLAWGDALFDPRHADAVEVLLRHVVPRYPVDRIDGWFPARPAWFDDVLRELGFECRPDPQDLSVMCVPFDESDASARIAERLYYTYGDSDLF
ncbi:MAG: GNAT family N-acetyltransferase [Acidobacteriota bacterium]|nr:GNAT family N-acetyltransferase [Acidobacteriota bacterium]